MNKYKLYMYVGISLLVLSIVGSSTAYYNYVGTYRDVSTITRGLDYYINYTKGNDITSSTLNPSISYTGGNDLTITLYKKDNTYDIYGHIYLDVSSVSTNLSSSGALKYVVISEGNTVSSGTLGDISSNKSYLLAVNIPLEIVETTYTVYLWYDSTEEKALLGENSSISATVRCEATMKVVDDYNYDSKGLANKIMNLYKYSGTTTSVINNNITYQYNTTNKVMKDIGGNIRYYGASPNNYVYFNCSDYSNQTSSTCEVWRIIGVFNRKVKIIRSSSIGSYSYDNKGTTTGAETNNGSNDWTTARIMKLLNSGYSSETGGSLYWNGKAGTCYSGETANATVNCDFTSTGLKNDITRNMISEEVYYLRDYTSSSIYANQVYNFERTIGSVYASNSTSWTGKIALPYVSDYLYAADLSLCSENLTNYSNSSCTSNNYLKSVFTASHSWLLNPYYRYSYSARRISSSGSVYNTVALVAYPGGIVPTLYLNGEVEKKDGNGSSSNPYQLEVN